MVLRGHIKDGVVVIDDVVDLPEGAEVRVEVIGPPAASTPVSSSESEPTLYDRMKPLIGIAEGLPADLAENHDHYVH